MRVLIASDKFKHSLSSKDVAKHLTTGLRAKQPELTVDFVAIADGGEGTVSAAVSAGFNAQVLTVSGPTGDPVDATMAIRGHEAVIEVAEASGLACLPNGKPDALRATSLGTGQLIYEALNRGCTRIYIGAGGSACTDGGAGLLTGLGARFLDSRGRPLSLGGGPLTNLEAVDLSGLHPQLRKVQFILASDVDNPLLGIKGAAAVFGPQKGATPSDVTLLDNSLARLVDVLEQEIGPRAKEAATQAGAGAAGGIGYAAIAVLTAEVEPGVSVVGRLIELDKKIQGSVLVITGEGSLDDQSLGGKAPLGVSRAAAKAGVPVVAVCGRTTLSNRTLKAAGFEQTFALTDIEPDLRRCMSNAGPLLKIVGTIIAAELLSKSG
ncbi:glycerate kinase [Zafaria sp. Z1313]|uniref:glycerate kinase n=1 Tax=unclassified Zafaria TaxID=2828765 RepID=UPI002E7866AB|nr:glycerate kinase [Zafaria sp. J156]MEE1622672.1 glycerate kinase [Zafaria sp. J156]